MMRVESLTFEPDYARPKRMLPQALRRVMETFPNTFFHNTVARMLSSSVKFLLRYDGDTTHKSFKKMSLGVINVARDYASSICLSKDRKKKTRVSLISKTSHYRHGDRRR